MKNVVRIAGKRGTGWIASPTDPSQNAPSFIVQPTLAMQTGLCLGNGTHVSRDCWPGRRGSCDGMWRGNLRVRVPKIIPIEGPCRDREMIKSSKSAAYRQLFGLSWMQPRIGCGGGTTRHMQPPASCRCPEKSRVSTGCQDST